MNIRQIPQIIEVGAGDDLTTVASMLAENPTREAYLVVRGDAHLWKNALNVQLFKRQLAGLKKTVVIITQDASIARAAERSGFAVVENLPPDIESYALSSVSDEFGENLRGEGESRRKRPFKGEEISAGAKKMYDIMPPEESFSLETPIISKPVAEEELTDEEGARENVPTFSEFARPQDAARISLSRLAGFTRGKKVSRRVVWGTIFALAVFAVGVFLFGFIPQVKVIVVPEREFVRIDIDIQASSNLSRRDEEGNIPAQFITVEKDLSKEFLSSGSEERQEKARGVITIYNAYSVSPQTLIETTRLVSQDGKTFRTTKTVVVPGAQTEGGKIVPSSIDVEVIAAEPGEEYNIRPSTFSIPGFKGTPKYTGFYGESSSPMQGGTVGEVRVILEEDIERAKKVLEEELVKTLREDFSERLPKGLVLFDEAKKEEILEITADEGAGTAAGSFMVAGKGRISAILFDENHAKETLEHTLRGHFEDRGISLESISSAPTYQNIRADFSRETLAFSVHIEQSIARTIDVEEIKEALRGKDEIEVRKYVSSREDIESAKVIFFPRFLVRSVPDNPAKIEVVIE